MKPAAYLTHTAPGRCRLRIPTKRHDEDYFKLLQDHFQEASGVILTKTNPVAASILILYDETQLSFEQLETRLQAAEHFELTEQTHTALGLDSAVKRMDTVDDLLKNVTSGQLNFKAMVFIVLVTAAIRQLQNGAVLGSASSLLWHALQILMKEKQS